MPAATSLKTRPRGRPASKPAAGSSRDISKYARVSKLKETRKDLDQGASRSDTGLKASIEILLPLSSSRKRKVDNDANLAASATSSKKARPSTANPFCGENAVSQLKPAASVSKPTPKAPVATTERASLKRKRRPDDETTQESRTTSDAAQAEALLERLNLQSSPARKRSKTTVARVNPAGRNILPAELIDLLSLHKAFLKTLSLHYAHNGTNAPVDLRAICPDIAQAWGKRKVTVEDVRRCIGISGWKPASDESVEAGVPFSLVEYGRGKICIEFHRNDGTGLPNEHEMNTKFESKLRAMWSAREDSNVQWFLAGLPTVVIKSSTATHTPPVLAKGQRRLEELKEAMVKKQQEKEAKIQVSPSTDPGVPRMSLLDRIRHKEAQNAQAPQGPTAAELQRQAALQRAEDVADVLRMLVLATSTGQPRMSFTMAVMLMKLKDSLRIPISSEEGACCIRLMATEVAPRWLRVVTIGGKDNVVIQTAFQPTKVSLQERVKELTKC